MPKCACRINVRTSLCGPVTSIDCEEKINTCICVVDALEEINIYLN
jgi:hypothetical protein